MVSFMTLAFVNLDISGGGGDPPPAQLTPQKPGMNRVKYQTHIQDGCELLRIFQ